MRSEIAKKMLENMNQETKDKVNLLTEKIVSKVDNFDVLQQLFSFEDQHDFYYVYILKRRKENPDMTKGEQFIKEYLMKSHDDFYRLKEEIVNIAEENNARVYVSLNKKNLIKIGRYIAARILTNSLKEYKRSDIQIEFSNTNDILQNVNRIMSSVLSETASGTQRRFLDSEISKCDADSRQNKKWLIDLDWDLVPIEQNIVESIERNGGRVLLKYRTPNGYHLAVTPFNKSEFTKDLKDVLNKPIQEVLSQRAITILYFNPK